MYKFYRLYGHPYRSRITEYCYLSVPLGQNGSS